MTRTEAINLWRMLLDHARAGLSSRCTEAADTARPRPTDEELLAMARLKVRISEIEDALRELGEEV